MQFLEASATHPLCRTYSPQTLQAAAAAVAAAATTASASRQLSRTSSPQTLQAAAAAAAAAATKTHSLGIPEFKVPSWRRSFTVT